MAGPVFANQKKNYTKNRPTAGSTEAETHRDFFHVRFRVFRHLNNKTPIPMAFQALRSFRPFRVRPFPPPFHPMVPRTSALGTTNWQRFWHHFLGVFEAHKKLPKCWESKGTSKETAGLFLRDYSPSLSRKIMKKHNPAQNASFKAVSLVVSSKTHVVLVEVEKRISTKTPSISI